MSEPASWETPLTDDEKELYDAFLGSVRHDFDDMDLALIRTGLDGRPVAVVCAVQQLGDAENSVMVHPLAILVDKDLSERLEDPTREEE